MAEGETDSKWKALRLMKCRKEPTVGANPLTLKLWEMKLPIKNMETLQYRKTPIYGKKPPNRKKGIFCSGPQWSQPQPVYKIAYGYTFSQNWHLRARCTGATRGPTAAHKLVRNSSKAPVNTPMLPSISSNGSECSRYNGDEPAKIKNEINKGWGEKISRWKNSPCTIVFWKSTFRKCGLSFAQQCDANPASDKHVAAHSTVLTLAVGTSVFSYGIPGPLEPLWCTTHIRHE